MADVEAPTLEEEEGATPEAETEVDEPETSEAEDADDVEGEETEEPEVVEINFGGRKHAVPRNFASVTAEAWDELVGGIDKYASSIGADYTRKTQEAAEKARNAEAAVAAYDKLRGLQGEALLSFARGQHVKSELDRLSQTDMNALWQSDPDEARAVSDQISRLRGEFQTIISEVNQREHDLSVAERQETERRMEEGKRAVERQVKNFDAAKVIAYAERAYGIPKEQAELWPLNPIGAVAFHKAMMWDELQAKAAAGRKAKPAAEAAPTRPIRGRGGIASRDPDKMSTEEWMRWRNKQLAQRRGGQ